MAFGRALLEQWVTFAEHAGFPESGGNAQVGWRAVNEAEGWPRHYAHGVIGARVARAGSECHLLRLQMRV